MPGKLLDHPQAKNGLLARMMQNVEADQAGVELADFAHRALGLGDSQVAVIFRLFYKQASRCEFLIAEHSRGRGFDPYEGVVCSRVAARAGYGQGLVGAHKRFFILFLDGRRAQPGLVSFPSPLYVNARRLI